MKQFIVLNLLLIGIVCNSGFTETGMGKIDLVNINKSTQNNLLNKRQELIQITSNMLEQYENLKKNIRYNNNTIYNNRINYVHQNILSNDQIGKLQNLKEHSFILSCMYISKRNRVDSNDLLLIINNIIETFENNHGDKEIIANYLYYLYIIYQGKIDGRWEKVSNTKKFKQFMEILSNFSNKNFYKYVTDVLHINSYKYISHYYNQTALQNKINNELRKVMFKKINSHNYINNYNDFLSKINNNDNINKIKNDCDDLIVYIHDLKVKICELKLQYNILLKDTNIINADIDFIKSKFIDMICQYMSHNEYNPYEIMPQFTELFELLSINKEANKIIKDWIKELIGLQIITNPSIIDYISLDDIKIKFLDILNNNTEEMTIEFEKQFKLLSNQNKCEIQKWVTKLIKSGIINNEYIIKYVNAINDGYKII